MAISSSRQNSSIGNLCHIVSSIHHESPENSPVRQTSIANSRRSNISDDDDIDENRIVRDTNNHSTPPRQQQQHQHIRQMSNADSVRSDSTSRRSPVSLIKTNHQPPKSNYSPPYRQQQEEKVSYRPSSPIVSSSRRSPISPIRTNIQEKSNLSPPYRQQQQEEKVVSHRTSSIASSSQRSPASSPIRTNNQEKFNQSPVRHHQQQQQQEEKVSHRTSSVGSSSRRSSDHFPPPPPQNFETFDPVTNGSVPRRSGSSVSFRSSVHEEVHSPDVSPFLILRCFEHLEYFRRN